jgi:integrase
MPKYEELRLATKKGTTQYGYNVVFRKHLIPAFGKRMLNDISEEDVQRFLNRKALDVAWNTLKNIKWAFSAIFTAAIKYRYAKQNPVRAADLPPEPVVIQQELPTAEQLQQLMDALDEETQMMVSIDCLTALRPSELLALRRSAIDFARKCLWVREAVNHGDIHTPKYHRQSRPIRLADADLESLQRFMAKSPDSHGDDWLFPNKAGTAPKEYVNILRRKIQPKARELGLPHVTWRLLRHWHSTVLQDSGVPVRVAQERLGHSRPETTLKHYTHVTASKADEAAQIVSTMFANGAS